MYTIYKTPLHMAAHLKRANCIHIHDTMLDMAVSLAGQVKSVKLEAELVGTKLIHLLRFTPPQPRVIGHITFNGARYPVVGERNVSGGSAFWLVQTMHGVRGVLKSKCLFESNDTRVVLWQAPLVIGAAA